MEDVEDVIVSSGRTRGPTGANFSTASSSPRHRFMDLAALT